MTGRGPGHPPPMTEQPNDTDAVNETDSDPEAMNPRDLRGVTPVDGAAEGDDTDTDADPENMSSSL